VSLCVFIAPLQGLLTEYAVVRQSTLSLFKSFSTANYCEQLASNHPVSVRAIGFITVGHQKHQQIFKERYL
jgi:hypothetical protein